MISHDLMYSEHNDVQIRLLYLQSEFENWFLPILLQPEEGAELAEANSGIRLWVGQNGRVLAFAPAPLPLANDPCAKPNRLGATNKRLKSLRALPLSEKVSLAHRVLDRVFEATDSVAVSFSGGRDSLVALHLTLQHKADAAVVFVNTSVEFPETLTYVQKLAEEWHLDIHEVSSRRNFWELTRERGLPIGGRGNTFFLQELSQSSGVKLSNACCNQLKITPARQFFRETGIEAQVTGLRVDESMMRRFNFADYGALRWSRDFETITAWPLFAWQDSDIEAYITQNCLPENPLYDMGYRRVGCWSCLQDFFKLDSRLFTLRRTHPGMYRTLTKQFGEEMLELLMAWGHVQDKQMTMEHFDGLYTPCGLELLGTRLKGRQRQPNLKTPS